LDLFDFSGDYSDFNSNRHLFDVKDHQL